ncbi:MAG: hypothetical protein RQ743_00285 [Bacteroidales bacterium]|nr:hypothetical protein [Bacteroidales bacterium]
MTKAEKLNPFFEYKEIHLKLEGKGNTNNLVRYIDSLYYDYAGRITESIYLGEKLSDSDSLIEAFHDAGGLIARGYPEYYYKHRACLLEMISGKYKTPEPDHLELMNDTFCPRMPSENLKKTVVSKMNEGFIDNVRN